MREILIYIGFKSLKSCLRWGFGKSMRWFVVRLVMFLVIVCIYIEIRFILWIIFLGLVIKVII